MNGKNKLFAWFVLMLAMAFGVFAVSSRAQSQAPGSSGDPLVSKSYVDSQINNLLLMINNVQPTQTADLGGIKNELLNELSGVLSPAFRPVRAEKGQYVLGGEGAEIILRSGRAIGWCAGVNGLVNATTGGEVFSNNEIPINNLLLVPRDDGRGVLVTSDEAWFIIKGGYQIVNP